MGDCKNNDRIQHIRQIVWDYHKEDGIFKKYSFPELCYKITCVAEQLFVYSMNPLNVLYNGADVGHQQDQIRHSYREVLKWAYRFCMDESSFSFSPLTQKDIIAIRKLFESANTYNLVRKAFDDFEISKYSVEVKNEKEIAFFLNPTARDIGADVYAHWVDSEKPEDQLNQDKSEAMKATVRFLSDPSLGETWKLYQNKPVSKAMFEKYYQACLSKVMADAEEKEDYRMEGYTLQHFRMVYAGLMALGLMRFHEIYRNQLPVTKADTFDSTRPIVYGTMQWLQSYLSRSLKIDENEVAYILRDLTYDADFHKNRITIIQPLFVFKKFFFYSPTIVYLSMQQDKLFFLYKEKDEYKPLISRIAKDRERIMTVDLKSNIEDNSNLKCIENYKIIEGGKILAEFDLIIFDQPSNKLLLTELKWFYKADGEAGHTAVDLKIQQAVKLRQNREQIARKYLLKIMEEAFSENRNQELPEVMSCIVSKNYSGSAFLDDRIPIFDQFLFLQEMEKNRYCLNDFFADVKSKRYLPGIADMGIQLTQVPIEYAGIKIWIPGYRNLAEATHNR